MSDSHSTQQGLSRMRLTAIGAVQGVGFRPFVYRLANELELVGFVCNNSQGVTIEVEGALRQLQRFQQRLTSELPPRAFLQSLEASILDPHGYSVFEIAPSSDNGGKSALVLPDLATCPECLRDISDPSNRRHRYPFTNCTNCGPRYSIIEALPYDRSQTTMKRFTMCTDCRSEYDDPTNRRFHAQPNACPACGPQLQLWSTSGKVLSERDEALKQTAAAIAAGKIVAVKGLGGFHLVVDATNQSAVEELRRRKHRVAKPLAVMFADLGQIEICCELSEADVHLITSVESPIVLVSKRTGNRIAAAVAPHNPYLGVMLPYTPLHHALLRDCAVPIVATSGNLSEEPICIDEFEALRRLTGIADLFLVHNRPIRRHVDDSVVRIVAGRPQVLRRARGYAPLPLRLPESLPALTAVGGHLKNCAAIAQGRNVFVSQHIGDLDAVESFRAFSQVVSDLSILYEHQPVALSADLHPDYRSTRFAGESGLPVIRVQHHYAHALSCIAENEVPFPVLAVTWDGTGYGTDGTVWGGEFLYIDETGYRRHAHLRQFRLPGGEAAIKEPRRSAAGVLYECRQSEMGWNAGLIASTFEANEMAVIDGMLRSQTNAPLTSSAGRLFDAVAALLGLSQVSNFEGEGAMLLEFAVTSDHHNANGHYAFRIDRTAGGMLIVDWAPLIQGVIDDRDAKCDLASIAAKFHNTLVEMIVAVAQQSGCRNLALTGGCFQNKYLTERAISRLNASGFAVYWHQRVPPNDGGIALGQIVAAAREGNEKN